MLLLLTHSFSTFSQNKLYSFVRLKFIEHMVLNMTDSTVKWLVAALLIVIAPLSLSKEVVKVGLAHFPPYIEAREENISGLAIDMIKLMNLHQSDYEFIPVRTTAATRHREFSAGRHDMSLFDNLAWGWKDYDVEATNVYLTGCEVYIASAEPGRDQSFFTDFENKKMIGMLGYHYGFAGFNSDLEYLRTIYKMELTQSNWGSIKMVLAKNRGDIAVVTKAFLNQYLRTYPEHRSKLLISTKKDQEYRFVSVIRKGIRPTVTELNTLFSTLENNGSLPALWRTIMSDN